MPDGNLFLGCVADDFTGASDAASFLAAAGVPTLLCSGVPEDPGVLRGCGAAVIALKTRSAPVPEAVADSLAAIRFFRDNGARTLYSKYCSTFDCTPEGNIGPVADAVLDELGASAPWTVLCPSLPVNGRTVRDGHLSAGGVPLHESSMRNHPLNPMWDSFLPELMRRQTRRRCLVLTARDMSAPAAALAARLDAFRAEAGASFFVVPDYENDAQGALIAELFGDLPFLTGGSGLLEHLAARHIRAGGGKSGAAPGSRVPGRAILLSGSCSTATRGQIRNYLENGGAALEVSPRRLLDGTQTADSIWEFVAGAEDPLVYSAGKAEGADGSVPAGGPDAESEILERTMSAIGRRAAENGFTRIFVAGGETSGAVAKALGFDSFLIGESVAPGVPLMVPTADRAVRVALKSGNFGQPDYFRRVLDMTKL